MSLLGIPIVTVSPQEQNYTDGSTLNISCTSTGYPPANYVWHRAGEPVQQSQRVWYDDEGTLYFSQTFAFDSGMYVCVGTNAVGQGRAVATVNYIGKQGTYKSLILQTKQWNGIWKKYIIIINNIKSINQY